MTDQTAGSVPKIRFKGFDAAWEPKKLGQIYTERNERGNDSLPILSVSIHSGISNSELSTETLGKKVRRSEDKSLYKHVQSGDLVLNMMRAWQGALGVAKIDGMVSPAYLTAIPDETIYPLFMDCGLRRPQIVARMNSLSYGVTDFRKRLYWDSFVSVEVDLPCATEQRRIFEYFSNLEDFVALHKRKHAKLVALKKAMLERMFPLTDASAPEVRFQGFDGDWNAVRFDLIATRRSATSSGTELPRVEYEDIASGEGRLNRDVLQASSKKKGIVFEQGDVLFGKLRPYLMNMWLAEFSGVAVGDFWVLKTVDCDPIFLFYLMQTAEFMHVANQSAGSKMPRSDWKLVSGTRFKIPACAREQRKIGKYLRVLETLIHKHETQIEKLQQIKLACLDEMFV
jgi:type I restriction enzyme S subunit